MNYNIERFDWNFLSLKKFLRKVTESESEKDFFIASSKIELPAEFHKFLMAAETQTSSEAAREIGIEEWGGPYYGRFLRRLLAGELFNSSREGRNATEADRNIYLDHVVFYDEVAKEPVWLFFYRAFRNQPVGRKPTERTQQEIQGVSEGVPGLSPVPVRKK